MTTDLEVKVDSKVKALTKEPENYSVILLNDDVTPMDFVIELLVKIFRHTPETAKDLQSKSTTKVRQCVVCIHMK